MNTLQSPPVLMGLKVTLTSGKVLSVVPVSGQAPEEALEQTLKRQGFPPPWKRWRCNTTTSPARSGSSTGPGRASSQGPTPRR